MTPSRPSLKYVFHPGAFCFALLVLLLYMVLRDTGLYPTIMGDEWTYSSNARLTPFAETIIPSYLYYGLYSVTNQCGDAFLACSRLINAVLFASSAPFIFLVARRVASGPVAAAVALLAVAGPSNSYTSYYMPEAMYFCTFWAFTAAVFWFFDRRSTRRLLCSAVLLGLLALIKVHALFLMPGYAVFLAYASWTGRADEGAPHWLRRAIMWIGLGIGTALAVRLAAGYLFAGANGLGLLGPMYVNQASANAPGISRLLSALDNLRGHVLGLGLLSAVPLAALLLHVLSPSLRGKQGGKSSALFGYTVLMMAALLGVTAVFTAAVAGNGFESNARLHMRYYDFLLPLLLIAAGSHISHAMPVLSWRRRATAALLPAALVVLAWRYLLPAFSPNYIDSPALYGYTSDPLLYHVLAGCAMLALLLWVVNLRLGAQLFVFVFTPLLALVAGYQVNLVREPYKEPDVFIKAGLFARDYLTAAERAQLVLIGDDAANLFKARFMIDDTRVNLKVVPRGQAIGELPAGARWLLVIGPYPAEPGTVSRVARRDFDLLERAPAGKPSYAIDFKNRDGNPDLRMWGLSQHEDWGRWSAGDSVQIEYAHPLPRRMRVRFEAAAYGPNAGREFVFRIGGEERRVKITEAFNEFSVDFTTSGADRMLSIEVPQPTSPQQLGFSPDPRLLGIGFHWLDVDDLGG